MSHEAPRYYLIKQSELNRLTYNPIQTERYGICKVVRRETACGIRSYNLTHGPEHDNQMREEGAKAERERVLDELYKFVDGLDPDFIIRERISIMRSPRPWQKQDHDVICNKIYPRPKGQERGSE